MAVTIQEQTFGFEMEFYGLTRIKAISIVKRVIGGGTISSTSYSGYAVRGLDGRVWKVIRDGSVYATRGEACEFVTPICTYEDLELVQAIIRAFREAGAGVNDSCGIHVHVGANRHNHKSLKNLVNIMYSKQDILYKSLAMHPARSAKWAKKLKPEMVENFKNAKPADVNAVGRAWYGGPVENHQTKYDSSRYHGLNLHSVFFTGTVEFRLFNSTTHAGRAKAYIQFCLAVSALAINSKSSRSTVTTSSNEKYTFRTWLLRLGLNGEEFKTCRHHMLANLEGDIAWRNAQ